MEKRIVLHNRLFRLSTGDNDNHRSLYLFAGNYMLAIFLKDLSLRFSYRKLASYIHRLNLGFVSFQFWTPKSTGKEQA